MSFIVATIVGQATTAQLAATAATAAITTTAVGTVTQMRAAKQTAKAEAAVYQYNAEVAKIESKQKERASLAEQRIQRDEAQKLLKKQRVLFAKGGVQMTGSPLEIQLEAAESMASDIATIAYERRLGVGRSLSRAGLEIFKAGAAKTAGGVASKTALFGGLSQIAGRGLEYQLNK